MSWTRTARRCVPRVSKGSSGEGEVTQVHYLFSLSLRIASGEGGGSGGGLSHWSCQEGRWRLTGGVGVGVENGGEA